MGDGIQKKYALILNGDTEARHLGNVERAVKALRAEGAYEISVASAKATTETVEHFAAADPDGWNKLLSGMKATMDDDDLLVVYVTGHGDSGAQGEGCVSLPSGCLSLGTLAKDLKTLAYGRRILVMDNCFSGSGFNFFADAKTTVVSQGSPGEKVSCQLFSPFFWSDQVPDADQDGKISIQERFQFAVLKGQSESLLQFYNPEPIGLSGPIAARPFRTPGNKPVEVNSGKELKAQLARLKPGQLALVDFSADWCVPCKGYQPHFEKLAKQYDGRFLMIHAEGTDGSEEDWAEFGIHSFPTVAFIDWNGKVSKVTDPKDPLASLALAAVHSPEEQAKIFIAKLGSADAEERYRATLALRAMEAKAAPAVPALLKALADANPKVRLGAVQALAEIGPAAAPAVPKLIALLKETDAETVLAAAQALGKIGPAAKAALPSLLKLFRSDLEGLARKAVEALGFNPQLNEHLVSDKTFQLAQTVVWAVTKIDPTGSAPQQVFLETLGDPKSDYARRHQAVIGLSNRSGSAVEAVPVLIAHFDDKDIGSKCQEAVAQIAKASPSILEQIARLAADKTLDPFKRFRFLVVLELVGPPAASQHAALMEIANDKTDDPRIRKFAATVLKKIDPAREQETAPVLKELEDVAVLFSSAPAVALPEPAPPPKPKPWSLSPLLEFSARKGAIGGGFGMAGGYRFGRNFELRVGTHFQGMHLPDAKYPSDFQLGARLEPVFHLFGSPEKSGPQVSLAEIGIYHLFANDLTGAYLAPLGLTYSLRVGESSALSLGLKPQLHWEGELRMGAGAQFAYRGIF